METRDLGGLGLAGEVGRLLREGLDRQAAVRERFGGRWDEEIGARCRRLLEMGADPRDTPTLEDAIALALSHGPDTRGEDPETEAMLSRCSARTLAVWIWHFRREEEELSPEVQAWNVVFQREEALGRGCGMLPFYLVLEAEGRREGGTYPAERWAEQDGWTDGARDDERLRRHFGALLDAGWTVPQR
jgi:hypothetical protein